MKKRTPPGVRSTDEELVGAIAAGNREAFHALFGIFIGERTVSTSPGGSIPAGTVMEFSTVTTAVVNSAP